MTADAALGLENDVSFANQLGSRPAALPTLPDVDHTGIRIIGIAPTKK